VQTVESILEERQECEASDIAWLLQKPLEDVYERLVHLEALGVARLVYTKACRKTDRYPWGKYHWGWAA
jgi:hypothetical protein